MIGGEEKMERGGEEGDGGGRGFGGVGGREERDGKGERKKRNSYLLLKLFKVCFFSGGKKKKKLPGESRWTAGRGESVTARAFKGVISDQMTLIRAVTLWRI